MRLKLFLIRLYYNKFSVEKRFEKWDYLDKTQWLAREALLEIQKNKLQDILKYSATNVPAFQSLKNKINFDKDVIGNLMKFPVTDKTFYREAADSSKSVKSDDLIFF